MDSSTSAIEVVGDHWKLVYDLDFSEYPDSVHMHLHYSLHDGAVDGEHDYWSYPRDDRSLSAHVVSTIALFFDQVLQEPVPVEFLEDLLAAFPDAADRAMADAYAHGVPLDDILA